MVIGFFRGKPAFEHSSVHAFPGDLGNVHGVSVDAARPPDPVAFAMDFLRGPDDSLHTSNEA
ncbi:hypothetical protein FJ970_22945 [Mesorhizobium sp. B2-1-8]|uniref:hypothetical protein n=1 Tax=Mesorhizobium sp. B2-1-8 TaxID=2589967 RepID=UPI0011265019|nr:hypothetical protein [Mesorhizobium sp. B2-1-8]UCI17939.1 hypothetical protein FJ970_22945 [Mesorhizobium sp. B2-1-8]